MLEQIQRTHDALQLAGYIADDSLTTTLTLARHLQRPLLLEGEAGVGKTAVAHALATIEETELIRLQCYEGIDSAAAVYEWNYTRQLLAIKLSETSAQSLDEGDIFNERYLLERPLLKAIRQPRPAVLLIDEIDRADEAFEAFLLEVLSEFTITVPELGTLAAVNVPQVVLTSNATRELSDALRRRCLYHYIDYPDLDKELHILRARLPDFNRDLLHQIATFVQRLRTQDLTKRPGVAETLDWARALCGFGVDTLVGQNEVVLATLGCLLKTADDRQSIDSTQVAEWLAASA